MIADLEKRYNSIIDRLKTPYVDYKFDKTINSQTVKGPVLPDWLKKQTLYEVFIRAFTADGTFSAFQSSLNRIIELGIDLIWLMPVFQIGEKNRKGKDGSPYAVQDYYKINPEFGTMAEFKKLVDEAHRRGFKIILDMVANHVAPDYTALQQQPALIVRDARGKPLRKIEDWSDIADLDYKNPGTNKHMAEVIEYWLKEFSLDGYRCDVAGMVPMDFWESILPDLKKIQPELFMLAEWDGPQMHEKVFHSTYDWVLYELMLAVSEGQESAYVLLEWQDVHKQCYPQNALPLRFLENHDLPRATKIFGAKGLIPFLTFIFTIDGLPLIYTGQETGTADYLSLFDKDHVKWEKTDSRLYGIYKQLIGLRKEHSAMSSAELKVCIHNQIPDVLMYEKKEAKDQNIIVILNFRNTILKLLPGEEILHKISTWKEIFNSENDLTLSDKEIKLLPYQAIIFQSK